MSRKNVRFEDIDDDPDERVGGLKVSVWMYKQVIPSGEANTRHVYLSMYDL